MCFFAIIFQKCTTNRKYPARYRLMQKPPDNVGYQIAIRYLHIPNNHTWASAAGDRGGGGRGPPGFSYMVQI